MGSMMTVKQIGFKEFASTLSKAPAFSEKVFANALDKGAMKIRGESQQAIKAKGTTYRGALQQRIDINAKGSGLNAERHIISNLPYSRVIETSKRGGAQPPSDALEKWAQVKLGQPGLGFVIARAIKERGGIARPNPFMQTGWDKGLPFAKKMQEQALQQLIVFLAGRRM